MASSLRKLALAVYLAAGFVFLRLLYGVVFGAGGGQNIWFTIPTLELPGLFSHVRLFGPVSWEMLAENFLLALPFALVILIFGALGILVKPARVLSLAARAKVGSQLLSALAIALIQIPSLASSWQRISTARKLRGEKRLRMLVALFEVSLTKALAIGLRLQLDSQAAPVSKLEIKSFVPAGATHAPVSLAVNRGELVVLTGPTGIGKTGLLEALAGLTKDYFGRQYEGEIPVQPSVQFLPQAPRDLLFGPKVKDELAGCEPVFGLEHKSNFQIANLSEGEAVQVALSRIFSSTSSFYLLDEPFASLDFEARLELIEHIKSAISLGKAVVVVEHQAHLLEGLNPRLLRLTGDGLEQGVWSPRQLPHPLARRESMEEKKSFKVPLVGAGHEVFLENVAITVRAGEAIALTGPNGAGKTTLLRALLAGQSVQEVAMVPELVEDFFVCQTLQEELERADNIAGVQEGFTRVTLESLVGKVDGLLNTHPRDLSAGQKLALACAMQISHKPKVLLIDEPVKGFDPELRAKAVEVLGCILETSTGIIFATHDREFASSLAERELSIRNKQLLETGAQQ